MNLPKEMENIKNAKNEYEIGKVLINFYNETYRAAYVDGYKRCEHDLTKKDD